MEEQTDMKNDCIKYIWHEMVKSIFFEYLTELLIKCDKICIYYANESIIFKIFDIHFCQKFNVNNVEDVEKNYKINLKWLTKIQSFLKLSMITQNISKHVLLFPRV